MSSIQKAPDVDADLADEVEPIDRIRGFVARFDETYLGGPLSPKETVEEYIQEDRVDHSLGHWKPEFIGTVDELDEGDGRTRSLSDVLPHDGPRGDVYQYVPRRDLREYKYVCETTETRRETTWSISGKERIEIEKELECSGSFTRECRGLPAKCSRCGQWVRPEDDK